MDRLIREALGLELELYFVNGEWVMETSLSPV